MKFKIQIENVPDKFTRQLYSSYEEADLALTALKKEVDTRINRKQFHFKKMKAALKTAVILPVEIDKKIIYYSVVEAYVNKSTVLRTFKNALAAENFCKELLENSKRPFKIMVTRIN